MADKHQLRQFMLQKRLSLSEGERIEAAERFAENFLKIYENAAPQNIAGYFPIKGELSVIPLLERLHHKNWKCALPITPPIPLSPLEFHEWQPEMPLKKGEYQISEPPIGSPIIIPDIILVPLLAYDKQGHRLGYGGGHYDITLPHYKNATMIGCAYHWQELETLPIETHDIKLTLMLADKFSLR